MGKLKGRALPSRIGVPVSRLRSPASGDHDRDAERRAAQHWRAWYGLRAWRRLSWDVRLEAGFRCALCGVIDGMPGQTVADHIEPHRGDRARFFDRGNLQCLCKGCHDSHKQARDRGWAGG